MRARFFVLLSRIRGWLFARRLDADFDQEIQTHLDLLRRDHERRGHTPDDAARLARIAMGGLTQLKEDQRERRGLPRLEAMLQDVRYACRLLLKDPGFTATAVLTLALGIGANTAVFSLLNGFLRPLPVPAPTQIVSLAAEPRGDENGFRYTFAYPALVDVRTRASSVAEFFAFTPWIGGLNIDGKVSSFLYSAVTSNYFPALGLEPALGRLLEAGDGDRPGSDAVVVLGYRCWQLRFGGDPRVLGKAVRINGRAATVVGVVPKAFLGLYAGTEMDGYLPLDTFARLEEARFASLLTNRDTHSLIVLGRLARGVTVAQAQSALDVVARELAREHPDTERGMGIRVVPERLARPFPQRALANVIPVITLFLLVLAGLVLMLACMNVANLLLVRASARQREMAVRAALGAGRGRLIGQALAESVLLAALGGVAGVFLGLAGRSAFMALIDIGTDFPLVVNVDFDWRVFLYALTAASLTGVTVGIWPAVRASRANAGAALHDDGRAQSAGVGRQRVRRLLVVAQVAGSLVLLIVAGLFVHHLGEAQRIDLGFDADHVLNVRLDPHHVGYDRPRTEAFYRELERRLREWPDVESVSLAFSTPMGYFNSGDLVFVDGRPPAGDARAPSVFFNQVDRDYFKTMQIPIVDGRAFTDGDDESAPRVAIVNQVMAARVWPGENPIGRRFRIGAPDGPLLEVVGVARTSKYVVIIEDARPYFYVPTAQRYQSMRVLQIRSTLEPALLSARVEREIRALDPELPLADLQTMRASLSGAMGFLMFRLGAYQAGAMGLLGLTLALVGVYGVVSYAASQRTREIGIRVALGAHPRDVMDLILGQGVRLVLAGVAVGLAAAIALTRAMASFFLLADSSDWITFGGVTLLLAGMAIWACYVPARRALRVDPMTALRHE